MPRKKFKIDTSGTVRKMEVPFTQVANSVLRDPRISLRAKGLFALMYGKPKGYVFDSMRLSEESKEGRGATLVAMNELIKVGFMVRKKLKTGRNKYTLSYPLTESKFERLIPQEDAEGDGTGF